MVMKKSASYALAILMTLSFMAMEIGTAVAANSCSNDSSLKDEIAKLREENAALKLALGQNQTASNHTSQLPVACGSINLRTAQIHVKCMTSKGTVFERVSRDNFGEAWKGPDGLIWSDRIGSNTQYYAVEMCKYLGGTLPTRADFERGETLRFREVLPRMENQRYWSSSVDPAFPENAIILHGNSGDVINDDRDLKSSFRCVER